ncbi:hypothetical protein V6N13_136086 [Hibiscus sabdariffa]|uniref:Uncharacterized protein n=1 Tax=Hibiscus sabdariffa TaxID=183260 RepID=A0ABR2DPP7_9ROSI
MESGVRTKKGGGIAGSLHAKTTQFDADLTLNDPNRKEYLEFTWANLRNMVEPSFADRSLINHRDYLSNGSIDCRRPSYNCL